MSAKIDDMYHGLTGEHISRCYPGADEAAEVAALAKRVIADCVDGNSPLVAAHALAAALGFALSFASSPAVRSLLFGAAMSTALRNAEQTVDPEVDSPRPPGDTATH